MNTRQLRHLLAVLEHGTLAEAAEVVHLSVPALSRSLRALEQTLGTTLFDRRDGRLRATAAAQALAAHARRMLFEEREARRVLGLMGDARAGTLRFGMGSSIARVLLAPLVRALTADSPEVRLHALVQSSDVLFEALQREQLDFMIGDVRIAAGHADMASETLHACRFAWYARRGHPLDGITRLRFARLAEYPLVVPGYGVPELNARLSRLYRLPGSFSERSALVTGNITAVLELVEGGDAIAPLSDIAVWPVGGVPRLAALDVRPALDLPLPLGLIRDRRRILPPVSQRAIDWIRGRFAQFGSSTSPVAGNRRRAAFPQDR
jgi:DNA-binding transcriptional LysR family regulator